VVPVVSLVCALGLQQLHVEPFPATVGEAVSVSVRVDDRPLARIPVHVELPGGEVAACGVTGDDGRVAFTPTRAGHHVFVASIDGVRTLAPLAVVAARSRWPLALGAVPLGLAFVWWNARRLRG
jgi:hypothetical protein